MDVLSSQHPPRKGHLWQFWYHSLEALTSFNLSSNLHGRPTSRERAQPTTFRIQISFLLLVTGHAIGLLVLVDNNYCTSLASPTASSGPELKSETAPNSKSGTLRYFSGDSVLLIKITSHLLTVVLGTKYFVWNFNLDVPKRRTRLELP